MKRLLFILVLSGLSTHQVYGADYFRQRLKKVFMEAEDASPHYQRLFYQALKDFGIENPRHISIKKTDLKLRAYILGNQIFINEEKLTKEGLLDAAFTAYHEAAHYALGHRLKSIDSKEVELRLEHEADYAAVKVLARLGKHDVIKVGIETTTYDKEQLQKKYDELMTEKKSQIKSRL